MSVSERGIVARLGPLSTDPLNQATALPQTANGSRVDRDRIPMDDDVKRQKESRY